MSTKKRLISATDYKLWQKVRDTATQAGFSTFLYYFDTRGRWQIFVKQASNNKIVKADFGDIVLFEKWHLIDTGHISIGGNSYKVESLSDTSLVYKNDKTGIKVKLIYKGDVLPKLVDGSN